MNNNAPTTERFRPAGHKAQELSEIVMPIETFKPVQRVIDTSLDCNDKTVGYLFRDVECKNGFTDDVVLSKGLLYDTDGKILLKTPPDWQKYENNKNENPLCWVVPSGSLTLELCYRSSIGKLPLHDEVQTSWKKIFTGNCWLQTSTLLKCKNGNAHVHHNWTADAGITPVPDENGFTLSENNTPTVNQFLHAILGKRSCSAQQVFRQYGTPVTLWTLDNSAICALVLGGVVDGFGIGASDDAGYDRSARGVTIAKKLLENPKYKVRDD